MKFGLVGYGSGGQHFHAPFIEAAVSTELVGVVARAPSTIAKVREDFPEMAVYSSLTEMIASGNVEAVTITTPPHTRRTLVLEAIEAGLHVVADKPFAPDAAGARELEFAAKKKGIVLGVYQNRRYDSDFLTLRRVLESGHLGDVWRVHSRYDLDEPGTIEAGPTGGVLRDLGSHIVDQMLCLFGAPEMVSGQLDMVEMPEGMTDAGFTITMRHETGIHSHVSASKLNRIRERTFRAYGSKGSYLSSSIDAQEVALRSGHRPVEDLEGWGFEPESNWGTLNTADGQERVPAEQGRYHDYYEAFAKAVAEGGDAPATPAQGAMTLAVLDATRQSAAENRSVSMS